MVMKPEIVDKIESLVKIKKINESQVDHLLTLIRKYHDQLKDNGSEYPLLMLFCDWSKHVMLDRNSKAFDIIYKLDDILFKIKDIPNNDFVIEEISKIISFDQLKTDLNIFLNKLEISEKYIFEHTNWLRFVVIIIGIVVDCSLILPDRKIDLKRRSIGDGSVVKELNFRYVNEYLFSPKKIIATKNLEFNVDDPKVLVLMITMSDITHIVLPYRVHGKFITSHKK